MSEPPGPQPLRAIENDALIESSFRRLLASIESEHEKIRSTWLQHEQERDCETTELCRHRQETDEWCAREKTKIDAEWQRLNKLSERIGCLWPEVTEICEILCKGKTFVLPRTTLCSIEGSYLAYMFSDSFVEKVPRDGQGRFILDMNPECFAIVVEYLQNRRFRKDAPTPIIPSDQQQNMDMMAEALKLTPFIKQNKLSPFHGTSLTVRGNTILGTFPGWQVIAALHPLTMCRVSYFEVKVLRNPDPKGGLAIGISGHAPVDKEIYNVRIPGSIMYVSGNGLVGDIIPTEELEAFNAEVTPVMFEKGSRFGVRHDAQSHSVSFFFNGELLRVTTIKEKMVEKLKTLFPIFAIYQPDQHLEVDFNASVPPVDSPAGAIVPVEG
eukprot:TRINITY_DN50080_c0_g1_i1.p1 TRINITY_DN50080_c0_g1~~TRINITY_DN50080_c0_g1_i1.p1  ORF type:complete len:383 (+),score=65.44 TRINITY_DN50080_c0_g1_i1:76-1224(+)